MTGTGHGNLGRRLEVPVEGQVERVPLPLVFQALAEDRKTGILTMQGDGDIVAVSFLEGAVVAADALNQTVEEGLGRVLVSRDLVPRETFDQLADEHQGGRDGTLADVLVARGLISRGQLLDCLRQQTLDQLFGILDWQTGEFKFYAGDEVSFEQGMTPIQVEEMLVELILARGEDPPRIDAVFAAEQPRESVRIVGQDTRSEDGGIWLALEEHALWQQTDGQRPARDVMPSMRPRRLQFALHRLGGLGLLVPAAVEAETSLAEVTIFSPPEPAFGGDSTATMTARSTSDTPARRLALDRTLAPSWVSRAAAVVGLIVLALAISRRPSTLLLGFPWQENNRSGFEQRLRESRMDAVETAARTHFLMEQRFPGSLVDLVDAGLLRARDLRDPTGVPMGYTTESESGFKISVAPFGESVERQVEIGADDFLLGDIRGVQNDESRAPLYLID